MDVKYYTDTPEIVKKFKRDREFALYEIEKDIKRKINESEIVLSIGDKQRYTINKFSYQRGVELPVSISSTLSSIFEASEVIICLYPYDTVITGVAKDHILMIFNVEFGMLDTERIEIDIPMNKVSDDLRKFIEELRERVI